MLARRLIAAVLLLLLPHLAHVASAAAASPSTEIFSAPEVAELDAALGRLAAAVRWKTDQDLDTIGYAFSAVHDIDRALLPADLAGAPLAALQAWLGWMGTIRGFEDVVRSSNWEAIRAELARDATSASGWISAAATLMHFRSLHKAGEDLARGLYGPAYAESIRLMYDEARRQRDEEAFVAVIKDYLRGQRSERLLAVATPASARDRGTSGVVSGSNEVVAAIADAISRARGRLRDFMPGEQVAYVGEMAAGIDNITRGIRQSVHRNGPFLPQADPEGVPWLGSIHGLRELQGALMTRYAGSLRDQQIEIAFSAATSTVSGLIEVTVGLGAAKPHAVMTLVDLAELGVGAASLSAKTGTREFISEVPQAMVWALAVELETLWRLTEWVVEELDADIARMAAAAVPEPDQLTAASCEQDFTQLERGKAACGLGLSDDGRLIINGQPATDVVQPWGKAAETMTIFPLSPSRNHAVVVFGDVLPYLVDVDGRRVTSFFVAKYGPIKWISWGPDDRHVALFGSNEGFTWLHVLSLSEHTNHFLPDYNSPFPLVFERQNFHWLDSNSFRVLVASCKGEYCGETVLPDDGTEAQFRIAEHGIDVVAIEDLSKVPIELARAIVSSPEPATSPASQGQNERLELDDGTVIVGTIAEASLTFASTFGILEIDTADIVGLVDGALTLTDGSVLNGKLGDGAVPIVTVRGRLEIPTAKIVLIARDSVAPPARDVPTQPPGQGMLTGRIVDNFDKAVAGATLRILGSTLETRTDDDGRYRLPFAPGAFSVEITADGHDPARFDLSIQQATSYPVEQKIVMRQPPSNHLFYPDPKNGWVAMPPCVVDYLGRSGRIGEAIDTFEVWGDAFGIISPHPIRFLDNTGAEGIRNPPPPRIEDYPSWFLVETSSHGILHLHNVSGMPPAGQSGSARDQAAWTYTWHLNRHSIPLKIGAYDYAKSRRILWQDELTPGDYALISARMDQCARFTVID